jgi:hypothetical protein
MKTKLPANIGTIEEAETFLTELYENGEAYHPEDLASDVINSQTDERLFTDEESEKLDALMTQIYFLPENGNNYRTNPNALAFDPCGFLLDLANENSENEPFNL